MEAFMVPPFVDGKKQLTPMFDKVIAEIFRRFDKDSDGALNTAELNEFAIFTNGEVFDEESLKTVYSHVDVNKEGHITLKGFKQMYACQCIADPTETWNDLEKHGFSQSYVVDCVMMKKPIVPKKSAAKKHK